MEQYNLLLFYCLSRNEIEDILMISIVHRNNAMHVEVTCRVPIELRQRCSLSSTLHVPNSTTPQRL
jgi:hypothetical protein